MSGGGGSGKLTGRHIHCYALPAAVCMQACWQTQSCAPMLYRQHPVRATAEAPNPDAEETAGSARMPAPTVVPATSAAAPSTVPGSCFNVSGLRELNSRKLPWPSIVLLLGLPPLLLLLGPAAGIRPPCGGSPLAHTRAGCCRPTACRWRRRRQVSAAPQGRLCRTPPRWCISRPRRISTAACPACALCTNAAEGGIVLVVQG